jgi:hypothetical protein
MEKMKLRFPTEKQLKKMDKVEAYDAVMADLENFTRFFFRVGYSNRDSRQMMYARMCSKKHFARYIKHALKEEDKPFPDGFGFILMDFINTMASKISENEELQESCEIYGTVLERLTKRPAKALAKELDIEKSDAATLAAYLPGEAIQPGNTWIFTNALLNCLSNMQKKAFPDDAVSPYSEEAKAEGEKDLKIAEADYANGKFLKKVFKAFFGKNEKILSAAYTAMMCERKSMMMNYTKSQKALWDAETAFLLKQLEKLPLTEVKFIVDQYSRRRAIDAKHDKDPERRIVLSKLDYDTTPKLVVVSNPDKYSFKEYLKKEKKYFGKKSKKK